MDDMRLKGFVLSVRMEVNWSTGIYNKARTTNLRISDIVLILPLNQLLSNEPAKIVAIPIQSSVIVP
jgi:hypothetical protein